MEIYSCMPNIETLDFWIHHNLNVLFHGRHGVGKTSIVIEAFNRNNLRYQMFSASTMDPWVDFIGVPKEVCDEKGAYLELIRPKVFRDDEIEVLFFDELNRSHKKVRNAIMELIQFKSINGRKFPKLRMIWGAVNPDDDENLGYDVEKLDPAQSDRFHVHLEIPYKPHSPYFRAKYGRIRADAAIEWWQQLPDTIKLEISPRRLEYAIQMHEKQGNLAFILPQNSNITKLMHLLSNGSIVKNYKSLLIENNENKIRTFLEDENNYAGIMEQIIKEPGPVLHLLSDERITSLASKHSTVSIHLFNNYTKYKSVIDNIAKSSPNNDLRKKALRATVGDLRNKKFNEITFDTQPLSAAAKMRLHHVTANYEWNDASLSIFVKNINTRSSWLHGSLNECVSYALTEIDDTVEKLRVLNSIIRIIKDKNDSLTVEEAQACLNIINSITSRTQATTLFTKTDNIVTAINKCVRILRNKNLLQTVKEFTDTYPHIIYKIILHSSIANTANCIIKRG